MGKLDFCSESLIFNGNELFMRGSKDCLEKDLKYLQEKNPDGDYIIFFPLEIGMSKKETTAIVHHILDHKDDGTSEEFRKLLEKRNLIDLQIFACKFYTVG